MNDDNPSFRERATALVIIGGIVISFAVSKADITEPGRELTDREGVLLSEMTDTPGVATHHHCFNVACCSWIALFGLIRANGALIWQLTIKCCVMKYLVYAHRSTGPPWAGSLGLWLSCCTKVYIRLKSEHELFSWRETSWKVTDEYVMSL